MMRVLRTNLRHFSVKNKIDLLNKIETLESAVASLKRQNDILYHDNHNNYIELSNKVDNMYRTKTDVTQFMTIIRKIDEDIDQLKKQRSNSIDLSKLKIVHTTCKKQLTKFIHIWRVKFKRDEAFNIFVCTVVLTVINVGLIVHNIFKEKPKKYY
jgi:hypothetical protein